MEIEQKNTLFENAALFVLKTFLVALVYFAVARLGLSLATVNNIASPVWPATGVALFFILIWGPSMAGGIFLGAFAANYFTQAPMISLLGIGFGNTLEAVTGIWLFHRLSAANKRLGPHARLINFVAVSVFPTVLSASFGSLSLYLGNVITLENIKNVWLTWWAGDTLGALILFPVAVKIHRGVFSIFDFTVKKLSKISLTLATTILSCGFVFATNYGAPFLFLIFISLLLAAIWFSPSWIYIISILICAIAIISTKANLGPFTGGVLNENLLHLQLFLAGVGLTAIVLSALRHEGLLKTPRLALLFGWLLTGMTFYSFYQSSADNDKDHFKNQARKIEVTLQNNLKNYIRILETGSGIFEIKESDSFEVWEASVLRKQFESIYPGISNIQAVKRDKTSFSRFLDTGQPLLVPIKSLESKAQFTLLVPFFKKQVPLESFEQRRSAFLGFISASVDLEKFVQSVLADFNHEVDVKILLGSLPSQENEDYLVKTETLLANFPVTMLWTRGPGFKAQSSIVASWAGFCGALISIFLAILLSGLENLAERAQKIAAEKNHELAQREKLWETLTDASPVGIFVTDENGNTNYINATFSKMMNRALPDILKVGFASFIHPEDQERVLMAWEEFKDSERTHFQCSFRFVCDSRVLYVVSDAVTLKDEHTKTKRYVGTVQDMTDLHLKQTALMASSRLSSLGEMAGGVAHEINNPLAIISGKAQHLEVLLKQNPIDLEKTKGHIQSINANVERIAKIIKGLRSIARDVPDDPIREVRAKDILDDTLELCRSRFNYHEVQLIVPLDIDEDLKCWARPEQITQVLLNLLNNAFDAVSVLSEKWVRVDIVVLDKKLQFSVTDSGKGLQQESLDKIFIPFFTTKEVGKGTGLGLSISRGIIEKHNGRLFIDNQSMNTKFIFELNV